MGKGGMNNRRGATRPYYRDQAVSSWTALMGVSFVVGCLCGATIALFVVGL
jgi:hypothetical protein